MSAAHRPRKRFGQHFLTDPNTIERIVAAIAPRPDDVLVEIGPGRGAITAPLAKRAAALHLVELDRDLASQLEARYADTDNVTVHAADALRFDFAALGSGLRIVGNLPYNISTPLLFHLIDQRDCIADMHFMLQKEVVERMAATAGSKRFGRLTVMLGVYLEVSHLFDVGPSAFTPPPNVESSVVHLSPRPAVSATLDNPAALKALVTQAFSQRRKTLHNALKGHASDDDLQAIGIDPGLRAEQLSVATWIALANYLERPSRAKNQT